MQIEWSIGVEYTFIDDQNTVKPQTIKSVKMSKRYCLALDLKDEAKLIEEYEQYHAPGNVWPEITQGIKDAGILDMEIYRTGNRLFMIMTTTDDFSPERKAEIEAANPKNQEWETLMWNFQQALPWAKEGEKWIEMKRIFKLD